MIGTTTRTNVNNIKNTLKFVHRKCSYFIIKIYIYVLKFVYSYEIRFTFVFMHYSLKLYYFISKITTHSFTLILQS